VALASAVLVFVLPSSSVLDGGLGLESGKWPALGIVLVALVPWVAEAVPLFVTGGLVALVGAAVLAPWLGVPSATFVTLFASDVSLLFLGGFVLSDVLRAHGLDRLLAGWVLHRTGSSSERVVGGVLLASAGLSMWMSNTAATAMMPALLGALLAKVALDDPLRRGLVFAVAAGANLGGMRTPIGSPPNAVAIASLERTGAAPTFGM
jgi:sodium-dependent dicarboxylate transporter 2/3/5